MASKQLHDEKAAAVEKVYAAAKTAVTRLDDTEWPEGFTCDINGSLLVLTSLNMKQPLFLGSDGVIYRREEDFSADHGYRTFEAPLMLRKRPSDILHIIRFIERLGLHSE